MNEGLLVKLLMTAYPPHPPGRLGGDKTVRVRRFLLHLMGAVSGINCVNPVVQTASLGGWLYLLTF